MQLNQEIINYAVTKKLIKKKQRAAILADCERLHMTVEEYLVNKDICTAAQINDAMGEFFCLPHCEMDMFEPDTELIEKFSYAFMRKHKLVPVSIDDNGVLLLAVGRPLSFDAMSAIATFHTGTFDTVLVPPNQVNTYIDSISAVESTSAALSELEKESGIDHVEEEPEQDVINAPSVRLVDS
ncbi:MAG: hypothetical protein IJF71_06445, partial [Clostridia bacterium]|nr:hypothetical protein [Clostridia bacterium]